MDQQPILSRFQFAGHVIRRLNIDNTLADLTAFDDVEYGLQVGYRIKNIHTPAEGPLQGATALTVTVEAKPNTADGSGEQSKHKTLISLELEGRFVAPADEPKDRFKQYLTVNACATLFSIARAIVSSVSSQCYINGSINLPMINVLEMIKQGSKANSTPAPAPNAPPPTPAQE